MTEAMCTAFLRSNRSSQGLFTMLWTLLYYFTILFNERTVYVHYVRHIVQVLKIHGLAIFSRQHHLRAIESFYFIHHANWLLIKYSIVLEIVGHCD